MNMLCETHQLSLPTSATTITTSTSFCDIYGTAIADAKFSIAGNIPAHSRLVEILLALHAVTAEVYTR
jgi:hypothetical protein